MDTALDRVHLPTEDLVNAAAAETLRHGGEVFLLDLASGVQSQLTSDGAPKSEMLWSPDSRRIVFSQSGDKPGIYHSVVGSGKATLVYPNVQRMEAWTPDGLLTRDNDMLALVPAPEENATAPISAKPRVLAEMPGTDQYRISPDGKWVAYSTGAGGKREVWVAAYPSITARRKVADGEAPEWRRDGRELVIVVPGNGLWSMEVKTGATFESSLPKPLINPPGAQLDSNQVSLYTISSDGKRFLVRVSPTAAANEVEPVHVILNWPSLLK